MKLKAVTIQKFRNFVEPQRIEIEDDVTVLVGKNESGKTTILRALHRLKPANGDQKKFDLVTEYPRWRLSRDRREGDLDKVRPIEAEFTVDATDADALEEKLPAPLLPSTTVRAARDYGNTYYVWFTTPAADVIAAAASKASIVPSDLDHLISAGSLDAAIGLAKERGKELKGSAAATVQGTAGVLEDSRTASVLDFWAARQRGKCGAEGTHPQFLLFFELQRAAG